MSERFFVLGVLAFAATIAFLVVAWLRGRSPETVDDPSILAAASAAGPTEVLHDAVAHWFPWWYAAHTGEARVHAAAATIPVNPAAMFAGIEAIGSETGAGLI